MEVANFCAAMDTFIDQDDLGVNIIDNTFTRILPHKVFIHRLAFRHSACEFGRYQTSPYVVGWFTSSERGTYFTLTKWTGQRTVLGVGLQLVQHAAGKSTVVSEILDKVNRGITILYPTRMHAQKLNTLLCQKVIPRAPEIGEMCSYKMNSITVISKIPIWIKSLTIISDSRLCPLLITSSISKTQNEVVTWPDQVAFYEISMSTSKSVLKDAVHCNNPSCWYIIKVKLLAFKRDLRLASGLRFQCLKSSWQGKRKTLFSVL